MAILGLAVVSVFQLFSMTLRSTKKAEEYTKAVFYARSMLDEAYSLRDPEKNTLSIVFEGDFKGTREIALKSASEDNRVRLYEITAKVSWPPSGSLVMKGLRTVTRNE